MSMPPRTTHRTTIRKTTIVTSARGGRKRPRWTRSLFVIASTMGLAAAARSTAKRSWRTTDFSSRIKKTRKRTPKTRSTPRAKTRQAAASVTLGSSSPLKLGWRTRALRAPGFGPGLDYAGVAQGLELFARVAELPAVDLLIVLA